VLYLSLLIILCTENKNKQKLCSARATNCPITCLSSDLYLTARTALMHMITEPASYLCAKPPQIDFGRPHAQVTWQIAHDAVAHQTGTWPSNCAIGPAGPFVSEPLDPFDRPTTCIISSSSSTTLSHCYPSSNFSSTPISHIYPLPFMPGPSGHSRRRARGSRHGSRVGSFTGDRERDRERSDGAGAAPQSQSAQAQSQQQGQQTQATQQSTAQLVQYAHPAPHSAFPRLDPEWC